MLHFRFSAHDPDIVLHQDLQVPLDLVRIFAAGSFKGRQRFPRDDVDLRARPARTVDLA